MVRRRSQARPALLRSAKRPATGANSTALGTGANAAFVGSTAIGAGAVTTRANQIALGTAASTYTAAGINSAASLAAQTGKTFFVTTDAAGDLAASPLNPASIAGLNSQVSILQQEATALQGDVTALQHSVRRAYEGTAIAIALGASALPDNKTYAVSAHWGTFRGENAGGVSAQLRLYEWMVVDGGVGAGFHEGGVGGRAGLTVAW